MKTTVAALAALIALVAAPAAADTEGGRDIVKKLIADAVKRGAPLYNAGNQEACAAVYETAASSLLLLAKEELSREDRRVLAEALVKSKETAGHDARAWALRRALDTVYRGVEPERKLGWVREAPLPEGFPEPGPEGRVVVKQYPRYRLARAEGASSFWTLFKHIKRNDIAMTAPVEMTMERRGENMVKTDMAFLYVRPTLGRTGADGRVEVADRDEITVLSISFFGPASPEKIAEARMRIEAQSGEGSLWRPAGDWRLLGYNSPMIPAAKRLYEVQLPVRLATP